MRSPGPYLRQHHVGLIAIMLVISGGTAYAVTAPKNSVVSSSIKNGAVKSADLKNGGIRGKDVKDGTLTGADVADGGISGTDVADGSVRGADIADGTVESSDLDPEAVDEVRVFHYGGGNATVYEHPGLMKATFSLSCGPGYTINSFASLSLSPGRAGVYGLEDVNQGSEPAGTAPLVGAATVSRLNDVGQPVGGAGFGGSAFGFGQLVMYFQTPSKDVYIDIKVSLCSARGTISIDHKPPGSVVTRQGAPTREVSCVATGDAYCEPTG